MPELVEQMYCSQQIVIPPKFPYVLKRFAKAAIKTQPHDLLEWSYHYFKALAEGTPPPVKLRLEYPVYSTEGGLTRGYLKVLANQLSGIDPVPLYYVRRAWRGSCLDSAELKRVLCMCGVHMREPAVPRLHFLAVAGGLLTKSLTHTMILLCETLTSEPEGGSAAIPVTDFLEMYHFLAAIDASQDCKYIDGYMEGDSPGSESLIEEEGEMMHSEELDESVSSDDYWCEPRRELLKLSLIDDGVPKSVRISVYMNKPVVGVLERSPSAERARQIERENYLLERRKRLGPDRSIDEQLREMNASASLQDATQDQEKKPKPEQETVVEDKKRLEIFVFDEDGNQLPLEFYGEPEELIQKYTEGEEEEEVVEQDPEENKPEEVVLNEKERIMEYLTACGRDKELRLEDLTLTLDQISELVDKYKSTYYDLSMVAGRQMSTTSAEFIVASVEREIMDYINEQIAILPDPDLKKKKAKPEEVEMIRDLLERFLEDNMDVIVPEIEEEEEEEAPIPDITKVFEVPGIGPPVDEEIVREFTEYALEVSKLQADCFMPRNIRHFLCPPLEKYIDIQYDKKEEVPTCGVIVD